MYCKYCGTHIKSEAVFCSQCGKRQTEASTECNEEGRLNIAVSTISNPSEPLPLVLPESKIIKAVRKVDYVALAFKSKEALELNWDWLRPVDVIVTGKYLALVSAPGASGFRDKAYAVSDAILSPGLPKLGLSGYVTKSVLAYTAERIGDAYEHVYGDNNQLSRDALNEIFHSGQMIYCDIGQLQAGYVTSKRFLRPREDYRFVSGKFKHVIGELDIKFYVSGVGHSDAKLTAVSDELTKLGVDFRPCGPVPNDMGIVIVVAPKDDTYPYMTTKD